VWLIMSAMAYRAVRNRRFALHRQWMIRSYVVAWGFVLGAVADQIPGVSRFGDDAALRWLTWVLPLVLCEVVFHWRATGRQDVSGASSRSPPAPHP
jgi:hypothetical protein